MIIKMGIEKSSLVGKPIDFYCIIVYKLIVKKWDLNDVL